MMAWLWYSNLLYWVFFFYLEFCEAFWAAVSCLMIGPTGKLLITRQRGLSRLAGLMPLPWQAFVIY